MSNLGTETIQIFKFLKNYFLFQLTNYAYICDIILKMKGLLALLATSLVGNALAA